MPGEVTRAPSPQPVKYILNQIQHCRLGNPGSGRATLLARVLSTSSITYLRIWMKDVPVECSSWTYGKLLIPFIMVYYYLKLKHLGFDDTAVLWFKSYLNERLQVTKINGSYSSEVKVTFGVPQGSILGPLLFSLYVNDLPNIIQDGFISLYADDTAICVSDSNPVQLQTKLEAKLALVQQWYQKNKFH